MRTVEIDTRFEVIDLSHLDALQNRLRHLQAREQTDLIAVWVKQCEKEIADEYAFLGIPSIENEAISNADLLKELSA